MHVWRSRTPAMPGFGARTFPTVITTLVVQDLHEKIAGVDCMMH
jgi:tellurite resistance protein TehA-like permease